MKNYNEVSNISKEEKEKIFNNSRKISEYVEPPAVKVGLKEVWILKDDCGHEPFIFSDRETPYKLLKEEITNSIEYFTKKGDNDYIEEYERELAELEESYAEGGDFSIDGLWYCHCYKVLQKDERPKYFP